MCMMCQDERSYELYMAYLDAVQKAGEGADHDKIMADLMKSMEAEARAAWDNDPWAVAFADKTLSTQAPSTSPQSPFKCSPADE
jgi:hypothetical protein